MKLGIVSTLILVFSTDLRVTAADYDLVAEITKAKLGLEKNFIRNIWYRASEAIIDSQDKLLKIYTQYTIQQAQNVIEHISLHQNMTISESTKKRTQVFATKNLSKIASTLQCTFTNEENTLKAYKVTGYNLHNCIRMAQNEMESKYLKILDNLNNIKNISVQAYNHYYTTMSNCVELFCILSNVYGSTIDYEKLKEDIASNVTEVNNISTRYVFSHIAMDCVSGSLTQISENYEVGKKLVEECLLPTNATNFEQKG